MAALGNVSGACRRCRLYFNRNFKDNPRIERSGNVGNGHSKRRNVHQTVEFSAANWRYFIGRCPVCSRNDKQTPQTDTPSANARNENLIVDASVRTHLLDHPFRSHLRCRLSGIRQVFRFRNRNMESKLITALAFGRNYRVSAHGLDLHRTCMATTDFRFDNRDINRFVVLLQSHSGRIQPNSRIPRYLDNFERIFFILFFNSIQRWGAIIKKYTQLSYCL